MITSKYPSSEVLKHISPKTSPAPERAVPRNAAPSSSTSRALLPAAFDVPFTSMSLMSLNPVPSTRATRLQKAPQSYDEAHECRGMLRTLSVSRDRPLKAGKQYTSRRAEVAGEWRISFNSAAKCAFCATRTPAGRSRAARRRSQGARRRPRPVPCRLPAAEHSEATRCTQAAPGSACGACARLSAHAQAFPAPRRVGAGRGGAPTGPFPPSAWPARLPPRRR